MKRTAPSPLLRVALLSSVALLVGAASAQNPGERLLLEEDGVSVYLRTPKGSPVGELVAVGEIDAPPEEVFQVLWDVDSYPGFLPTIKETRPVSQDGESRVDYFIIDTVLFAQERDLIAETAITEKNHARIVLEFQKAPDSLGPASRGEYVRIPFHEGSWELLSIDGGQRTRATYRLRSDPGGKFPQKLMEEHAAKNVVAAYRALRERLGG